MHVVAIDRPSVDRHLVSSRDFRQQLTRSLPNVPTQNRVPILRYPHEVVLAVPDRVTPTLRVLHERSVASRSPKGEGFTDPRNETLKDDQISISDFIDKYGKKIRREILYKNI